MDTPPQTAFYIDHTRRFWPHPETTNSIQSRPEIASDLSTNGIQSDQRNSIQPLHKRQSVYGAK
jgi:hypothetical protein